MSNPRKSLTTSESRHGRALQKNLEALFTLRTSHKLALPEQPFDALCLSKSHLYRTSRALFLKEGGHFTSMFMTSPRALSSTVLLTNEVCYSPIESELRWRACDPVAIKSPEFLLELRTFAVSVFHEQSHRLLWRRMGRAPKSGEALHRFLNLAESLVITADMALADELGPGLSGALHLSGVLYDPGTTLRKDAGHGTKGARIYRNCLQVGCHATYLLLEGYTRDDITELCSVLYPDGPYHPKSLIDRMIKRALTLDQEFISRTNPIWQRRYAKAAAKTLSAPRAKELPLAYRLLPEVLDPGADPTDQTVRYALTEAWLAELST